MDSILEFDMDEYSIIIQVCILSEIAKESTKDEEKVVVKNIHFKGRFGLLRKSLIGTNINPFTKGVIDQLEILVLQDYLLFE